MARFFRPGLILFAVVVIAIAIILLTQRPQVGQTRWLSTIAVNGAEYTTELKIALPEKSLPRTLGQVRHYRADVTIKQRALNGLLILHDGCIKEALFNGAKLDLQPQKDQLCGKVLELTFPQDQIRLDRANVLDVKIRNTHSRGVFNIVPVGKTLLYHMIAGAVFVLIACLWDAVMLKLRLVPALRLMGIGALALTVLFIVMVPQSEFAYDMSVHLTYVSHIARTATIPPPTLNYVTTHPPLYYVIAAPFYALANAVGYAHPEHFSGFVSLVIYLVFLTAALLIVQESVSAKHARISASTFFLFALPYVFTVPFKVTNDGLFFAFFSWSLLYVLRWNRGLEPKHLLIAIWLAGFSVATKNNGLFTLGVVGLTVLYALWQKRTSWRALLRWPVVIACVGTLLLAGTNFGRNYLAHLKNPQVTLMNGKTQMNTGVRNDDWLGNIDNNLYEYITIDVPGLISPPYWNSFDAGFGRTLYWNSFIKTLIYGEFTWGYPEIAQYLTLALLLLFCWVILIPILCNRPYQVTPLGVVGVGALFVLFSGSMMFRFLYSQAPCANARYIFPVVILFAVWIGHAFEHTAQHNRVLYRSGQALLGAACSLSVLLMVVVGQSRL